MTKVCEKMNLRNRMARYASRASSDYHTYQFFKDREREKEQGVITSINESSATIMLVKYGLECKYEFSPEEAQQTVEVNKGQGMYNQCVFNGKKFNLFDYADVTVAVEMHGFHKKININVI